MSNWPLRLMIYGAGEAIGGSNALAPQIKEQVSKLSRVCTNQVVVGTAQLDSSDVPTKRLVLDPSGRQPILSLPNVNVGDPQNLIDFVTWSRDTCPADRSILVLSGHGAAWQDAQVDAVLAAADRSTVRSVSTLSTNGAIHHPRSIFGRSVSPINSATRAVLIDSHSRDYISNAELGAVCEKVAALLGGPLEAIIFDACLMCGWEILAELEGATATVIGSIDELSAAGIPFDVPVAQLTAAGIPASASGTAKVFADNFVPNTDFDSCVAIDLGGADWREAKVAFKSCCGALLEWMALDARNVTEVRSALALASSSVVQFSSGGLADAGALMRALSEMKNSSPVIVANSASCEQSLAKSVISHTAGRDYQNALGISIFSPSSYTVYQSNRPDYSRLSLPNAVGWLAVLDAVFGA